MNHQKVIAGTLIILMVALFCSVFFSVFSPQQQEGEGQKEVSLQQKVELDRAWADEQASKVKYFQDERTGLCFAFYGYLNAPALTAVPYEKVKHVLMNPVIEKEPNRKGHPSE